MSFLFRRERPRAGEPRRESTQRDEPQPPFYRSPTFRTLVSRLAGDEAHNILDLQQAVGANVEFFSRFSCRLQIVDLLAALAADDARRLLLEDAGAAFRRVLPDPTEPWDVVLAWEVFNYLDQEQFRRLVERLGSLCSADALILAFIATGKEIPLQPPVFRIVDGQTLHWAPRGTASRAGPRFPPALVERLTHGFAVVHSVLMRQGVQEYLFERRPDPADAPR